MPDRVRIGIIGAGNFTRSRLLPNLQAIPDVDVVIVANSTPGSAERVAGEFGIPRATDDWREVIQGEDVDAVLVGTQPYFHHQAVMNALQAGKHVLCQTRMATSLRDAREMLRRAQETGRKTMLVRSGNYLPASNYVKHLLDNGYVGEVRQVFAYYFIDNYVESAAPLHRRQDSRTFGDINPMALGIYWDVLRPWFGDPARVFAHARVFTPEREETPGGMRLTVDMPDAITVMAEMPGGTVITCIQSGVARFGYERIEIYGEEGTLVYPNRGELLGARRGDPRLVPLAVPPEMVREWSVEQDFVGLIRGQAQGGGLSFEDGVKNIEFLEAAHRAARDRRWVEFPLV